MSDGDSHPGAGWAGRAGRIAAIVARELALPVAAVVTTPLRMARGQLRRAEVPAPDIAPAAQAVVLVHGFASAPSCWFALTRALRAHGVAVATLDYSPFEASVEQLAERLATVTHQLAEQSGARTVHLVGHSLGGLVIAQALTDERLAGRVDGVVTISSPFGGSPWADLLPLGPIGKQLRAGSPLLRRLAGVPAKPAMRWLAFSSTLDVVVPGGRAVPANTPVEHVVITEAGHAGMPLNPLVIERIVSEIVDLPREDSPSDAQPLCGVSGRSPEFRIRVWPCLPRGTGLRRSILLPFTPATVRYVINERATAVASRPAVLPDQSGSAIRLPLSGEVPGG